MRSQNVLKFRCSDRLHGLRIPFVGCFLKENFTNILSVPVPAIAATRRRKQSRVVSSKSLTQSNRISKTTLLARLVAKTSVIPRNPTLGNNRGGERVLSAVVDLHALRIPRGRHILKVILFFLKLLDIQRFYGLSGISTHPVTFRYNQPIKPFCVNTLTSRESAAVSS